MDTYLPTSVVINMAPPGQLARKVVKRSNARITLKYPSWKIGEMVQCESRNERNCMLLLDVCPAVLDYRAQPCLINFEMDGQQCLHYPDVWVMTHMGQHLIEIKATRDATDTAIQRRTEFLVQHLPRHGFSYHLIMAESLNANPRLATAEYIRRQGNIEIPMLERERIRGLFMEHHSLPWGVLQSGAREPHLTQYICRLILEGAISLDIHRPLTDASAVRWVFNPIQVGGASWESLISKKAQ